MVGDRGVDTKTEPWLSIYNSADSVPRLQDSCQLRRGQTFPMTLSVEGGCLVSIHCDQLCLITQWAEIVTVLLGILRAVMYSMHKHR